MFWLYCEESISQYNLNTQTVYQNIINTYALQQKWKTNNTPVTTSSVLFIVRMCSSHLSSSSSSSSSRAANMNARIHHATQLLVICCKPRDITSKKTSSGRNYSSKGHRAAIWGHWPSQIFVAKGHTILEVTERLFGGVGHHRSLWPKATPS